MVVACAMSAHILCENFCGVANSAISRFVPDVGSAAFEGLETCSCGLRTNLRGYWNANELRRLLRGLGVALVVEVKMIRGTLPVKRLPCMHLLV